MSVEITVPGSYVLALLKSIELQGQDVNALLNLADIDAEELSENSAISAVKFGRFYQQAIRETRDESFGMFSANKMPIGSFKMMCYACLHAQDLEHAVARCSDFYEILRGSVIKPVIEVHGQLAAFRFTVIDALPYTTIKEVLNEEGPILIRAWFSMWHHFLSWLIGQRMVLNKARFTFRQPDDVFYYKKLFHCPIEFQQDINALYFDQRYLRAPLVQTEKSLRAYLKSLPYQLIVMPDDSDSMASRVSAVIGNDFSHDIPTAEAVAKRLGLSVSSLRRRLLREQTSYQRIKDECRQAAAMRFLAAESMSICDVATMTGFDDPSTFFRAFRKWTGMTPGQYRDSLN